MAITQINLRVAEKSRGKDGAGQKVFLVGSDVNVATDIDPILDASIDSTSFVPAYDDFWSADRTNIQVVDKRAQAHDMEDGAMQGFWWLVFVEYATPDSVQTALDPRDRDWEWNKGDDKRELAIAASTFDTSGYIFPGSDADHMLNLGDGDAFVMTNGVPPETGVPRPSSRKTISLTKWINEPSDLGLPANDWEALDSFVDKVNDDAISILDVDYEPRELMCEAIPYGSVTENGFTVVKVTLTFVVDKEFKHIFSYPSAGFEETDSTGGLKPIRDKEGSTVSTPQLLDLSGQQIPNPTSSPFTKTPVIVSGGRHVLQAFSTLSLPSTIP